MLTRSAVQTRIAKSRSAHRCRVAYVVHTFARGGLEHFVARLATHLDRRRFQPCIICLNRNGSAADWIRADDVEVVELMKREGNDPAVVLRLAKVFRRYRVQIVQSHNWGTLLESVAARLMAKVPLHIHAVRGMHYDTIRSCKWRRSVRTLSSRWALNRTDHVVTVADSVRHQLMQDHGQLRPQVQMIANGVDAVVDDSSSETAAGLRCSLRIPTAATVIGSVGRLVPVKNFALAIEATAVLANGGCDVHLVIVGDGPERESLTRQAVDSGISERVHLVGQKSDISHWLSMLDIYVNSSLSEGMSQSLIEAMSAGLPLVTTDVGDNKVLVHGAGACGVVVPSNDPIALSGALRELMLSPQLLQEFSRNARIRHADNYTFQTMRNAYESLYADLYAKIGVTTQL